MVVKNGIPVSVHVQRLIYMFAELSAAIKHAEAKRPFPLC